MTDPTHTTNAMHYHTGQLVASTSAGAASLSILWQAVVSHAPAWQLVPPLLLSVASCVASILSAYKLLADQLSARHWRQQALRHAEELHRARLARIAATDPDLERLDDRA